MKTANQKEAENAAKLLALQNAARIGWRDLEAGRYRDVSEGHLADYIGQLGARASQQDSGMEDVANLIDTRAPEPKKRGS